MSNYQGIQKLFALLPVPIKKLQEGGAFNVRLGSARNFCFEVELSSTKKIMLRQSDMKIAGNSTYMPHFLVSDIVVVLN